MVLHTDQKHPHVHLVVKAEHETEPGKRLHIKKAMLRQWREQFAQCLREQGVAANATPGHVRGRPKTAKKDPIHQRLKALAEFERLGEAERARRSPPKESTFMRDKVEAVARELQAGRLSPEAGKEKMLARREATDAAWHAVAARLKEQGKDELAREVESFVHQMPPVRTEKELIARGLLQALDGQRRRDAAEREGGPDRER